MRFIAPFVVVVAALAAAPVYAAEPPAGTSGVASHTAARALLDRYCVSCHSDRLKTGGLTLQSLDLSDISGNAGRLEKVVKKLRAGTMPPPGNPRPDATGYLSLRHWLEGQLDQVAAAHPNPGRTESLH